MNDVFPSFSDLERVTLRLAKSGIDITDVIEQLAIVMPDKLRQLRQQVKQLNSPPKVPGTIPHEWMNNSQYHEPHDSSSWHDQNQYESRPYEHEHDSSNIESPFGYNPGQVISPKKGLTPYGWIGPKGDFYHVPGYAQHWKTEDALKNAGVVPSSRYMGDDYLHVSPENMRMPDNLTDGHMNTLHAYRDQVMGDHPNFRNLSIIDRKHIDDFTNDAQQTMDRNYANGLTGLSLSASFPEGLNQMIKKASSNRKCALCGQSTDSHAAGCATNMNVQDSAHNYTKKGTPRKIGPSTTKGPAPLHSKADLTKIASHIEIVDIPMKDIEMDSEKDYNFLENYQLNKVLHTYLKLFVYQTLGNFSVESVDREGDTLKVKILVFDNQIAHE